MVKNILFLSLVLLYLEIIISVFSASFFNNDLYIEQRNGLDRHNYYRAIHGVPALTLDQNLNNMAQSYAEFLAENNYFNGVPNDYGENSHKYCSGLRVNSIKNAIFYATDRWYNEIEIYNFSNPRFNIGTGHFTQLVWKNSKQVGFGVGLGTSGDYNCVYIVAMYDPPGNTAMEFEKNVFPRKI